MTRPSDSPESRLEQLASLYGVQTSYVDASGESRDASRDTVLTVLRCLGAPIAGLRDVTPALAEFHRSAWNRLVEPVLVAWDGRLPAIHLRLPDSAPACVVQCTLERERSGSGRVTTSSSTLASLPTINTAEIDGTRYVERRFELTASLPPGYHHLRVGAGNLQADALIISSPSAASSATGSRRREWGLFTPTYALHSRRSWGIGDLRDLSNLAAWAGRRGAGVVGTLPLHPTFLEQGNEISPYAPISRFFLNEIYIDIEAVPEFRSNPQARRLAGRSEFIRIRDRCKASRLVDYRRVLQLKRRVLEEMSRSLMARDTVRARALSNYLRANPTVADYARFRAVGEREGIHWQGWPGNLRGGRLTTADADPGTETYHAYAQWLAHQQLDEIVHRSAASGVSLYFDLPLGVHASGYDTYRNRDLFVPGLSVGAPPDSFFTLGQNWGFPPLHPQRMREQRHRYFIDTLRHQLRHARLLRIDHIMGLSRMFLVPEGASAADAAYLRYPEEELYAILCLEARRARAGIIGEDLGTVPPQVRDRMDRHGVKRMYVLPLEIRDDPVPLPDPPDGSLATLNTHDMPPFAAFWKGLDIADRRKLGLLDQRGVAHERMLRAQAKQAIVRHLRALGYLTGRVSASAALTACMRFLAASRASLVLLNLEDLWLETRPQNTPGTVAERPNWRRKLRFSLEQITSSRTPEPALLRALGRLRRRSHRRSLITPFKRL